MTPVRRRDLLVVALGAAVVAWLFTRADYGSIPPLRWWLPLPVGVLAVAEALGARTLQTRLEARRRPGPAPGRAPQPVTRPVEPLLVARVAVLAQASAWTAAAVTGLWVGVLLHTGPAIGTLQAAAGDTRTAVLGALLSAALVAAALWLEHVCRVPPDRDDGPASGLAG